MTQDQRMIEKQAEIISRQNKELRELKSRISTMENYQRTHKFYLLIQNEVQKSDVVKDQWNKFLSVVRLSVEQEVPGLTEENKEYWGDYV